MHSLKFCAVISFNEIKTNTSRGKVRSKLRTRCVDTGKDETSMSVKTIGLSFHFDHTGAIIKSISFYQSHSYFTAGVFSIISVFFTIISILMKIPV